MSQEIQQTLKDKVATKELTHADLTFTTATNVKTSNAVSVINARSLSLYVKADVASLVHILDADATTALGVDVILASTTSGTLGQLHLDLRAKSVKNVKFKIDGQTAPPVLNLMARMDDER